MKASPKERVTLLRADTILKCEKPKRDPINGRKRHSQPYRAGSYARGKAKALPSTITFPGTGSCTVKLEHLERASVTYQCSVKHRLPRKFFLRLHKSAHLVVKSDILLWYDGSTQSDLVRSVHGLRIPDKIFWLSEWKLHPVGTKGVALLPNPNAPLRRAAAQRSLSMLSPPSSGGEIRAPRTTSTPVVMQAVMFFMQAVMFPKKLTEYEFVCSSVTERQELLYATAISEVPMGLESLKPIAQLGKGHFGRVLMVGHRETGTPMALKAIPVDRSKVEMLMNEKLVLECISLGQCASITRLLCAFYEGDSLYLACELCPGGDLWTLLKHRTRLPEKTVQFIAGEIIMALHCLHSEGIVHRDIKPENILLTASGHVKLTDFGLAKFLPMSASQLRRKRKEHKLMEHQSSTVVSPKINAPGYGFASPKTLDFPEFGPESDTAAPPPPMQLSITSAAAAAPFRKRKKGKCHCLPAADMDDGCLMCEKRPAVERSYSMCGTSFYMAPEMLSGSGHDLSLDWWQLGCVMHELLGGTPAFYNTDTHVMEDRIMHGSPVRLPESAIISYGCMDLIGKLLVVDPRERLGTRSTCEICNHRFFEGTDWPSVQRGKSVPPLWLQEYVASKSSLEEPKGQNIFESKHDPETDENTNSNNQQVPEKPIVCKKGKERRRTLKKKPTIDTSCSEELNFVLQSFPGAAFTDTFESPKSSDTKNKMSPGNHRRSRRNSKNEEPFPGFNFVNPCEDILNQAAECAGFKFPFATS
uniref:Protein kinase domain-containing protein n=1 Tax=Mucochytrium quahogii TaxID=96639 RepID=A0A7S2S9U4_9STRA|mmetsp:Transcript_15355/g.25038  ORF Transcript_15355/g.25038 Transcript_15355/m.25038 type:complete len:756 (+) Transcript_15355:496-2763(+)